MAEKSKKSSSKFDDVAKPGDSPISDNARPTINKHQMIAQDPMMSTKSDDKPEDVKLKITRSEKIKITPISEDFSEISDDSKLAADTPDSNENESVEKAEEDEAPDEKIISDSINKESESKDNPSSDSAAIEAIASAADLKKVDAKKAEEDEKKQQEIKELIKSRKYSLPIVEGGHKATSQKLMTWILLLMILASVGVYLAVDAGYLNIGIDLPHEFIKN